MKFITPKIHGIIDLLIVVFLLSSPVIFGFTGILSVFTYALGAAHLILTLCTDFNSGIIKLIPFNLHEAIEFAVAVMVIITAYTLFKDNSDGKLFYVIFGNCILLTWLVTDYKSESINMA